MEKQGMEKLFQGLAGKFDTESPPEGHQQRFLDKLEAREGKRSGKIFDRSSYLKPLIGIAASVVIIISIVLGVQMKNQKEGLASVSPKMAETQHFFTTTIETQLRKIEKKQNPQTEVLIRDAMAQMKILETEYADLQKDLITSGENSKVISAMVTNFQNRIKIVKNLLEQIKQVERLKLKSHENPSTI